METVNLIEVGSQLRLFNKEQGKPCAFSIDNNSIIFENYEININASWLAQLGLYTLLTMKQSEIDKLISEQWVTHNVIRHNHLVCVQTRIDLSELNKLKGVKASITSTGNIRLILSNASSNTAITEANIKLANLGYNKAIYSIDSECYVAKPI